MRAYPLFSAALVAMVSIGGLTNEARGSSPPPAQERQAGPLRNNGDANSKCPRVCAPITWNGQWRTTVPGRMSVCSCVPGGAQVPPPPPQVRPPGKAIDDGRFAAVLQAVQAESSAPGRLLVIGSAAKAEHFLVAQVRQLLDQLTYSKDKIRALELLAPRIADRNNIFMLFSAFSFEDDKARARTILGQ